MLPLTFYFHFFTKFAMKSTIVDKIILSFCLTQNVKWIKWIIFTEISESKSDDPKDN